MSRVRLTLVALLTAVATVVTPAHASGPIVPPIADLELTGSAPAEVANGEPFTHTFTVRNLGPDTAVDVVVEGVDGTELGGSCDLKACKLGDLAAGATATVTATWAEPAIFPAFPGTFRSAARVTSATQDPNPANDSAVMSTYRRPYDGPPIGPPPTGPTPSDPPPTGPPPTDPHPMRLVQGSPRADLLRGSRGDDVLRPGRGRDRVIAGAGDDVIFARDGERDVIDCGPGRDRVRADRRDVLRRCEQVTRRAAAA